jgi:hypothetical protein
MVMESVDQVLKYLDRISINQGEPRRQRAWNEDPDIQEYENVSVLITGSLHLVGAYLSVLDPDLVSL